MKSPESLPDTDQPRQTKQAEEEFDYGEEYFSGTQIQHNENLEKSFLEIEIDPAQDDRQSEKTDNEVKEFEETASKTDTNTKEPKKTEESDNISNKTEESEKNAKEILPQTTDTETANGNQESSDNEWDELQLDTQKSR